MDERHVHAAVELVNKAGKAVEVADNAGRAARVITASQAFREYSWLRSVPVMNAVGDLGGMVLSREWRVAYSFTAKHGEQIERYHVGSIASIFVGVAAAAEEINEILNSKSSWDIKGARLGTQATGIAMKVLTGIVTAPALALLQSMQGYCYGIDLARGTKLGDCAQTLNALQVSIESSAKQVSDGNEIYLFVNTIINPRISKLPGVKR